MQIGGGHLYHAIIFSMYQNWRSVKCYVIGILASFEKLALQKVNKSQGQILLAETRS